MPHEPAPTTYVGDVLSAVHALSRTQLDRALDEADAALGVDTVIDEVVFPALRLIGLFWASGTMDVAHEHLLSGAVARWVAVRSAHRRGIARQGTILLAAGPQDLHTLALDCLDLLLTTRGVEVCNLGAQTPVSALLAATASLQPTAVVLSSQNPVVSGEAVLSVRAVAEAGVPVYVAGSSFVLQHVRQNAPGIPLDATLGATAELLTARHTTALPGPARVGTGRRMVAAVVLRAVAVAREVRAVEAASAAADVRQAVAEAAATVALAASTARTGRADAARSAAAAVASRAESAAAALQRQTATSALHDAAVRAALIAAADRGLEGDRDGALATLRLAASAETAALQAAQEASAAATRVAAAVSAAAEQVAHAVHELDAAITREVAAAAAQVHATTQTTARRVAAETAARAADVATVAREAATTTSACGTDDDAP